jgi:F-type H+-transporting ATPase subunit epsilon
MDLQLITLAGVKLDEPVYEVMLPTTSGDISVFPGHEPLVAVAKSGVIAVRRNKQDSDAQLEYFAITGGVIEINPVRVRVLVDEAEHGDDIIEAESKAALDRAIALRDSATNQVELEKAHQLVDRHMVRLKVADLQRRHRR